MRWLFLALTCLFPALAAAQTAATLVADQVTISTQNELSASGNVEVFYDGNRLSAGRITYSQAGDRLTIAGPILIQSADGTILTATQATMDPRLENGILLGARLVLNQQLQLAANQIDRRDGRFSQLYKVAATSCNVCGTEAPLWEIRAERVVHDQAERQLYFENATFRVRGVPLVWIPQMRLPDPTLTRATGLLLPRIRTTDQLGTGIKLPYFIKLGDHRDLQVTPYFSPQTKTVELRYRQAFVTGDLEINGAISSDALRPDITRGYLFAAGDFGLAGGYGLSFNLETVSDPAYLLDYGYSDKDRLASEIRLLRVREADLLDGGVTVYRSLRENESNATLPPIVADLSFEQKFAPRFGGTLTFGASADAVVRFNESVGELGRDVARAGVSLSWTETLIAGSGLVVQPTIGLAVDAYRVADDSAFTQTLLRAQPQLGVALRWPLMRNIAATGVTHLIEPVVALAWSDVLGDAPPNEDSTRAELDQANLFALDQFPGNDAVATGPRVAFGATWTRAAPMMDTTLTFGRVVRRDVMADFSPSSGLDGRQSDWLLAGQIATRDGVLVDGRSLFDDNFNLTRAAARIGYVGSGFDLNAAYIWQAADSREFRPKAVSEWTLATNVQVTPTWGIGFDTRYDVAADEPARAALSAQYRNECVTVDLSVSRRFTSSTTVSPSTDYGLSVSLNGFSAGRPVGQTTARCSN